jgi:hypothetical protein
VSTARSACEARAGMGGSSFNARYDHRSSIRTVLAREAGLATELAEAYGRLTGRPGVCSGQATFLLRLASERDRLHRLLLIFIDNACRVTPPLGRIGPSVVASGSSARSRSETAAPNCPPARSPGCSSRSTGRTPPEPAPVAAPGWGWRSRTSWRGYWAARSAWRTAALAARWRASRCRAHRRLVALPPSSPAPFRSVSATSAKRAPNEGADVRLYAGRGEDPRFTASRQGATARTAGSNSRCSGHAVARSHARKASHSSAAATSAIAASTRWRMFGETFQSTGRLGCGRRGPRAGERPAAPLRPRRRPAQPHRPHRCRPRNNSTPDASRRRSERASRRWSRHCSRCRCRRSARSLARPASPLPALLEAVMHVRYA